MKDKRRTVSRNMLGLRIVHGPFDARTQQKSATERSAVRCSRYRRPACSVGVVAAASGGHVNPAPCVVVVVKLCACKFSLGCRKKKKVRGAPVASSPLTLLAVGALLMSAPTRFIRVGVQQPPIDRRLKVQLSIAMASSTTRTTAHRTAHGSDRPQRPSPWRSLVEHLSTPCPPPIRLRSTPPCPP